MEIAGRCVVSDSAPRRATIRLDDIIDAARMTTATTNINNFGGFTTVASRPSNVVFRCGSREMIRLEPNGDIFIRGTLITNDMEVIEELKNYYKLQGNLVLGGIHRW